MTRCTLGASLGARGPEFPPGTLCTRARYGYSTLKAHKLYRRRGGNQPCQPRAATLPATLSQITWTPALFKAVTTSIALS